MRRLAPFAPLALALLAVPALAQQPAGRPAGRPGRPAPRPMLQGATNPVAAGTYTIDPGHTQVTFQVSHMGISPYAGTFSNAAGTLVIDPGAPAAATVDITLPVGSVETTSTKLTEELRSADWLDAAKFPQARFVSTQVMASPRGARIMGNLTLHGVTKPVVIDARLFGSATNPMSKKPSIGFTGRMLIKRSEFGVTKYIPLVSDETELVINAAFEKR